MPIGIMAAMQEEIDRLLKELPAGHCPHVETTAEFVRTLDEFLPKA